MEYLEQPNYHHFQQLRHDPMPHGIPLYHDPQDLRGYAVMAHRQPAAMMEMPHSQRANDTKPRLGKDEVEVLEREFKKNPKPSTQAKRKFAGDMRVDLARINNWFQNRRAKRKQELKMEAKEAGQAREALGYSKSRPDSDFDAPSYLDDSDPLPIQEQPSSTFPLVTTGPPPAIAPYNPQYADPTAATIESFHRTVAAAQAASKQHEFHDEFVEPQETMGFADPTPHNSDLDRSHFSVVPPYEDSQYQYTSFSNELYAATTRSLSGTQSPTPDAPAHFVYPDTSAPTGVHGPQPMSSFSSQLLDHASQDGLPLLRGEHEASKAPEESTPSALAIGFNYEEPESEDASNSPPAPSIPFKSPPPTDIASRRKKVHVKPAALTADTMRRRPSGCPRTVSHADGFRLPADSPMASPMRRIVSAGGNRGILSGRINKGGIESAQRSPINLGGLSDASSFLERNYHSLRPAPPLSHAASLSSLAPPTPLSPRGGEMTLGKREGSWSSASPVDNGMNFIFNARVPGCFTTVEGDQNLASPPETPQDHLNIGLLGHGWSSGVDIPEEQWTFDVPDEPLCTPAQDSFSFDLQMPQPSYLSSLSQPVTPAFGSFNPNFTFGHESPQQKHGSPRCSLSNSEYSFPESQYPASMSTSPMSKHTAFQFSNATAADFSEK